MRSQIPNLSASPPEAGERVSFRRELDRLVRGMRNVRASSAHQSHVRPVGARTASIRTEELFRMFDTLRLELGFKIETPWSLKERHVRALLTHWHEKGLSPSTLENRLSHLRVFAELALRKKSMIPPLRVYLPDMKRSRIAVTDKSVSAVADPENIVLKALDYCPHVGVQLWLQWQFSLRAQEAICLHPTNNDLGSMLSVLEGTKGGRPRFVPITTAGQRACLEAAKEIAKGNRRGKTTRPRETLAQSKSRFYYVCHRIGLTRAGLGVTPHGMRHEGLQAEFKRRTGVDAPVKAVGSHNSGEKTLAQVSRSELDQAQYAVSNLAGHNRKDAAGAYLGSIPAARRRALVNEHSPKPARQEASLPPTSRMDLVHGHSRALQIAQQTLRGNDSYQAGAAENGPGPGHVPAAEPIGTLQGSNPAINSVKAVATHVGATSGGAKPQPTMREGFSEPIGEDNVGRQTKAGLMSRILRKKTHCGPMQTLQKADVSGVDRGENNPFGKGGLPDDRDPYAKPDHWE